VTSFRAMPSLIMLAAVAFSSVFTPILGGSLQPFFGQFMELAKQEQELIKQQNLILEKILQAQDMMAQESGKPNRLVNANKQRGKGKKGKGNRMKGQSEDSIDFEAEYATAILRPEHVDTEPQYATAIMRPEHVDGEQQYATAIMRPEHVGDYMSHNFPNYGKQKGRGYQNADDELLEKSDIPREWVDKYRARKGDGNSLYLTIPRNHPDGDAHYFNGNELMAAAKELELILNDDGIYEWDEEPGDDDSFYDPDPDIVPDIDSDEIYTIESTEQDSQNGDDYQMGDGGPRGRNRMQARESYSDDALPREWMDKYNARQGDGNSLYMTIPRDGNAHYFNVQELKDAARGK